MILKINSKNLKDREQKVQKNFQQIVNLETIAIKIKMSIFYLIMANISSMKMHRVQNSKNLNARNKI